jgi:hypothetical protein
MTAPDIGFFAGIADVASGRGQFRLLLQPLIAIFLGARLGIADAKEGKDPFFLRLFMAGKRRAELAKNAATDVLLPFCIAVVVDGILQYLALGYVRPLAALFMGAVLIWLPFGLSRSIANRIFRRSSRMPTHAAT